MKKLKQEEEIKQISDYKYGFNEGEVSTYKVQKGLNEEVVREISKYKEEPEWMLNYRLESLKIFDQKPQPSFGPDLNWIDFNDYYYYTEGAGKTVKTWDEIPEEIKRTFDRLGIPEAEKNFLAGINAQWDARPVYERMNDELTKQGVIFTDCDTALRKYPELFKKHFGQLVKNDDNKYASLNGAVWSGGTFIYVPSGVKLEKPLQAYFRINYQASGQFERTLIIVEDDAELHYIEGCTAPIYSENNLHAAIVEIYVGKRASVRYTTVQNWSDNVLNLVTKRSIVEEDGRMEWIDGNIGSKVNMKYPSCILKGDRAQGDTISIAVAKKGVYQDAGSKMIHLGKETKSKIVSKSITFQGGTANYRGLAYIGPNAINSKARVECDTLILDNQSHSDTIPQNKVHNNQSQIEHEATVSKVSEEQLFYLMSRGLDEQEALEIIVMGFLEPFTKELPLEYAVELNQLIKMDMEGSVG
ncbi:Fe-S cluster assembly protein SufB [Spiroplasma monobiae]|uniref:Fe-S cluster assembly protein SufB n=1 Tax=Spiroplasma monobiae MQ-1 TaxID=1336748 RepID=A0A2K9LVB9_SPISQ|nr:Fe-S cluster assembly protein SufB [Spiroplasma monobiae]AUM62871.1 Fe-S cluster assembly protein SufB [Spiroplasma monobiae MQ-1]